MDPGSSRGTGSATTRHNPGRRVRPCRRAPRRTASGEVKWDVQLTPSGTYAHAAPWNDGKFGKVNGSHGCIGMSTEDAKWWYDQVHLGDVVTVINSKDTVATNNGYGDWNVDWAAWKAGSALDRFARTARQAAELPA
ncbi:L,D-transpeptidase [Streptomyces sp. NPDC020799]|uniref:L,D-transpeptidase n=1 Tax=Streptomyces sp. NPDC020799 TaxID=3365091 RepID=UPI00378A376E